MAKKILILIFIHIIQTGYTQNLSWAITFGSHGEDRANALVVDKLGNSYITGSFNSIVNFTTGGSNYQIRARDSDDVFITKLNSSGNLIWVKSFGGVNNEKGTSIAMDSFGSIFITGNFNGSVDFDPDTSSFYLNSNGASDIFISKFDSSGKFIWAKSMGGSVEDLSYSLKLDLLGNIFIAGTFRGTADFNPSINNNYLTSSGLADIFILKLNPSGNYIWVKQIGGTNNDRCNSLSLDSKGNVYTSGYFEGLADFEPNLGTYNINSKGGKDVFISKLDSSGNFKWAKCLGGTLDESSAAITTDSKDNLLLTGEFFGTVDFDPGSGVFNLVSAGYSDIFILKLDTLGNFVWGRKIGGTSYDRGYAIAVDLSGCIYSTGYFDNTVDFDPNGGARYLTGFGNYISKLDSFGYYISAVAFVGYVNSKAIDIDKEGNIYSTGGFIDYVDFDPGVGIYKLKSYTSMNDIFVTKLCAVPTKPDQILGNFSVCTHGMETYSILPVPGASGYTWRTIDGATIDLGKDSLSIKTIVGFYSGYIVVSAYNSCGYGKPCSLFVSKNSIITKQPLSQNVNEGDNVRFIIKSSNSLSNYQWQLDSGGGFHNLSTGGKYSGVTNDTLSINNVDLSQNYYSFRCYVNSSTCHDTSNVANLTFNLLGINLDYNQNEYTIYPNPSKEIIFVSSKVSPREAKYTILDAIGAQVLQGNLINSISEVNIKGLAPGLYFLLISDVKLHKIKFIKV